MKIVENASSKGDLDRYGSMIRKVFFRVCTVRIGIADSNGFVSKRQSVSQFWFALNEFSVQPEVVIVNFGQGNFQGLLHSVLYFVELDSVYAPPLTGSSEQHRVVVAASIILISNVVAYWIGR